MSIYARQEHSERDLICKIPEIIEKDILDYHDLVNFDSYWDHVLGLTYVGERKKGVGGLGLSHTPCSPWLSAPDRSAERSERGCSSHRDFQDDNQE